MGVINQGSYIKKEYLEAEVGPPITITNMIILHPLLQETLLTLETLLATHLDTQGYQMPLDV